MIFEDISWRKQPTGISVDQSAHCAMQVLIVVFQQHGQCQCSHIGRFLSRILWNPHTCIGPGGLVALNTLVPSSLVTYLRYVTRALSKKSEQGSGFPFPAPELSCFSSRGVHIYSELVAALFQAVGRRTLRYLMGAPRWPSMQGQAGSVV